MSDLSGPAAGVETVTEASIGYAGRRSDTAILPAAQYLRRQRAIEAIHQLGPRVVGELLDEIGRHHNLRDDIERRLAQYASLDPGIVRAVGADRFPASPLHLIAIGDG